MKQTFLIEILSPTREGQLVLGAWRNKCLVEVLFGFTCFLAKDMRL